MEWTGLNDLREKFLHFFETKDHLRLASFPLLPSADEASLLLINSGMAPMKNWFMGVETPPRKRVTTCQKCIRTPDIENVGKTSRHGTYFEMLGNFSFGDYFKSEATAWAWEFITQELKLPVDRLWVSIYESDDEAFDIWTKEVGVDPNRIVRLGKADNFWEIGSGPCGPCSEIYFDRGEKYGCDSPTCAVGCDCDRYVEFWNLVFTQFQSDGEGNYTPLEHPNIDTGMGLERLACIMQGVDNLFEVDTVQKIMGHIADIAKVKYHENENTDVSLRVITDHIRSTTFMVGDGILPQNEGRGYVLRRLLRRAARHGRLLGIKEPFLYKVCETVITENQSAYPNLVENKEYIIKVIEAEEGRFARTIDQGMDMLTNFIEKIEQHYSDINERKMRGEDAFKLYDTFGFPIDLIREILQERKIQLDEAGFKHEMNLQVERAQAAHAAQGDLGWEEDVLADVQERGTFVGYTDDTAAAKIVALLKDNQRVDELADGEYGSVVLDVTPFYAESGGQVGDSGEIAFEANRFEVTGCKKSKSGHIVHVGKLLVGTLHVGDSVTALIDAGRRQDIMRNHTACHLLQAALRDTLGTHVHQAGAYYDEHVCRLDFSHFSAVTDQELRLVEEKVNEMILSALDVRVNEMPIEEAKQQGAMALFGEKYGERVRVCNVEGASVEFCGGTHVKNTSHIGLFKITKESSVAAGVRRIEALTGRNILKFIDNEQHIMMQAATALKLGNTLELPAKIAAVYQEMKETHRQLEAAESRLAQSQLSALFADAADVNGIKVASVKLDGVKPEAMRVMGDASREKYPDAVCLFIAVSDGKAALLTSCGKGAVAKGANAGKLMKAFTALCGGSGGGRPDSAMGGSTNLAAVDEARAKFASLVEEML